MLEGAPSTAACQVASLLRELDLALHQAEPGHGQRTLGRGRGRRGDEGRERSRRESAPA